MPAEALLQRSSELEAARCALEWARAGDVLVLPVHGLAAREAVLALIAIPADATAAGVTAVSGAGRASA
jgi:hypothetical protein